MLTLYFSRQSIRSSSIWVDYYVNSLFSPDSQRDPDFCIVARVEAFIAGWGLEEVLKRSNAYADAGADAILMHSKRSDPSEIKLFMEAWNNKVTSQGSFI